MGDQNDVGMEAARHEDAPCPTRAPRVFERESVRLRQIGGEKVAEGQTTAFSETGAGIRIKLKTGERPAAGEKYEVVFLSPKYACLPVEGEIIACEEPFDAARFDSFVKIKWSVDGVNDFTMQMFNEIAQSYLQNLHLPGEWFLAELTGSQEIKVDVESISPGGMAIRMPVAEEYLRITFGVVLRHRIMGDFPVSPVRFLSVCGDPPGERWHCQIGFLGDTKPIREYLNSVSAHESRRLGKMLANPQTANPENGGGGLH